MSIAFSLSRVCGNVCIVCFLALKYIHFTMPFSVGQTNTKTATYGYGLDSPTEQVYQQKVLNPIGQYKISISTIQVQCNFTMHVKLHHHCIKHIQ